MQMIPEIRKKKNTEIRKNNQLKKKRKQAIYRKIIYHPCHVYGRKSDFGIYHFSDLSGETHLTPGGSKYILQN